MLQVLFICFAFGIFVQEEYQFVKSVDIDGQMHFSDPLGNVYIVKDNSLRKYSAGHTGTGHYTNTFLGNIYSIDVSDPLRILLFYKDHNQIVWVDNFLSEIRSPVWLDELGIDQFELVCSSSRGGFWVFNSLNNQLQYYDVNLKQVHESPTLNMLTGPDVNPTFMIEKNRSLYLNVPGTGILVFDHFGNFSKTLPVIVPSAFQVTDRHIYFMQNKELYSYDLRTAEMTGIELPRDEHTGQIIPESEILKVELQPGFLFLFTIKGYWIYKPNP
jgi:hypothetical protein